MINELQASAMKSFMFSQIRKKRKLSNPNLLVMLLLTLAFGCKTKVEAPEDKLEVRTFVTLTNISIEPIAETIDLNAVSCFLKKSIIKCTTAGTIEDISVNLGNHIAKGQVLFTLKTKEALALEGNLKNDSNLNFKGLLKIKAAKSGIISNISHQKGDYVQEGDELATISEEGSLVFLLQVPFELRNYVYPGGKYDIELPDRTIEKGTMGDNLSAMDITSQTINYKVIPSVYKSLPENLIAKIRIVKKNKNIAFVLPKQAVLSDETQTNFWVMKLMNDSTAIKIPVTKGIETFEKVEILQPVFTQSDRFILTGNYGLPDTAKVSFQK
jgi:hypothetical protein